VYNRVTNQPLLALEVDGFAFHENSPDQRARDARKDAILDAHQMPLLRLPTTGSREHQQIRRALDNAEAHWARMLTGDFLPGPSWPGPRLCQARIVRDADTADYP
jgi:hypothetical protein